MEKGLTVTPRAIGPLLPMLSRAQVRGDTTAGAATVGELCQGGQGFEVSDSAGRPVMAYVLAIRDHAAARVCWVQAAGGAMPGVDLTRELMPTIERQAQEQGAWQVAITTRRRGLIKKLRAQGYQISGVTLRKEINGLAT
ncbi:hypothetical protein C6571_16790 [Simplicispira suum]|uniref:Uncharacterized protein n=1 Tax=Simplicispira suum TaxID=2109915 RepID=A0A2S0N3L1_9BURK|nr:hypothetical protein C6571_16790 [Simplicispira suum]